MRVLFAAFVLLLSLNYGCLKLIESSNGLCIIGGTEVAIKQVPFMVVVRDELNRFICGGAIVGQRHVLTAAHCCDGIVKVKSVNVGTDSLFKDSQTIKVEEYHIHPNWSFMTLDSDICVLKLAEELSFSEIVNAIPMADNDLEINEGDMLETIGFGATKNTTASDKLLKVSLEYVPNDKCHEIYAKKTHMNITTTMLCAGGVKDEGPCYGDSGSPIFYKNQVVGLTSFGDNKCADAGVPSGFARISALRSFVDGVINGRSFW